MCSLTCGCQLLNQFLFYGFSVCLNVCVCVCQSLDVFSVALSLSFVLSYFVYYYYYYNERQRLWIFCVGGGREELGRENNNQNTLYKKIYFQLLKKILPLYSVRNLESQTDFPYYANVLIVFYNHFYCIYQLCIYMDHCVT